MKRPAIILVGYNRPASLKRLLHSIEKASYSGYTDIPLIISIDGGGDQEVVKLAESFAWKNGTKEIINHPENFGLRKHILFCGDLSLKYESVIVLEDDCLVSKNFYHYTSKALAFYDDDENISGVGLYAYQYNENASLPFSPLIDGNEVYFLQHPCSWGQAWTAKQWQAFKSFYDANPKITSEDRIPESVKNWPESSWKKYFAKYMAEQYKYFIYPNISYATTFADLGVHWKDSMSFFQVTLEMQESPDFEFVSLDDSYNKYDAYFEIFPSSLIQFGVDINPDTCIDVYGTKQLNMVSNKFLLSSKLCNNPIKSFGADMVPLIQNILYNNQGDILSYSTPEKFIASAFSPLHNRIMKKQQPLGYYFASKTKYYKIGYYLLHPMSFIMKQIKQRF